VEQIFNFEELTVKSELDLSILNTVKEEIHMFESDKIKYFELPKIQDILIKYCEIFLKQKESSLKTLNTSLTLNDSVKNTNVPKLKSNNSIYGDHPIYYKMDILAENYQDTLGSTYDSDLALISIFNSADSEVDIEMDKEVFKYLLMKLSDSLTQANFKQYIKSKFNILFLNVLTF
jgi:hypothetical protein